MVPMIKSAFSPFEIRFEIRLRIRPNEFLDQIFHLHDVFSASERANVQAQYSSLLLIRRIIDFERSRNNDRTRSSFPRKVGLKRWFPFAFLANVLNCNTCRIRTRNACVLSPRT